MYIFTKQASSPEESYSAIHSEYGGESANPSSWQSSSKSSKGALKSLQSIAVLSYKNQVQLGLYISEQNHWQTWAECILDISYSEINMY